VGGTGPLHADTSDIRHPSEKEKHVK
jgi:hypothetical protein